ncbi:T9SS type A sorting domain-containing protein [Brumimicrobium aurantiacum]|uniref:T9SS C-terminal target domain-containing protein n=1 Tax=Brumimicrobium aurantiacum TaxID=1737063 RepID=A0A3E1EYV3_9FLAO|nr:T9SS type A sorting domain-containing protein [Brumimicrobium aurantiacum]RFC54736.1 T9SS C-terminal target domain-containing protein [Brumimicrobium aurantiacum]
MKCKKYPESKLYQLLTAFFIFIGLSIYANDFNQKKTYFNHLVEINKEWNFHKEFAPEGIVSFDSDEDRIQLHLHLVTDYLKQNTPKHLNATQVSKRLQILDKLQIYADRKIFPINQYHSIRTPYFIDELGTHCAVGQMISESGNGDLAFAISQEHNYNYLSDIQTKGLKEWAIAFGFTIEELKWIQPNYAPQQTVEQISGATNGPINSITSKDNSDYFTFAGNFTELDNLPCLNIGYYRDNQLSCIGHGLEGKINEVHFSGGSFVAFGEINHNGNTYPVAIYNGTDWNYIEIPQRIGAIAKTAYVGNTSLQFDVVIAHPSLPNQEELWQKNSNGSWTKSAKVNGFIKAIDYNTYGLTHVGHFDTVTIYNSNATIDTSFTANNVFIKKSNYKPYGLGAAVSDTVNTVLWTGNSLIFGGYCSGQGGENNICLSRYYNSVLQPLYITNSTIGSFNINSISMNNSSQSTQFIFGGDFNIEPLMGTYGSHLASYNLITNQIEPLAGFDQPVKSIVHNQYSGDLYIGGMFENNFIFEVNYLAKISSTLALENQDNTESLNIYPNPFSTTLNIEGIENGSNYSILHIDGKIIQEGTVQNERIIDLENLPNGSYLLKITTKTGSITERILK